MSSTAAKSAHALVWGFPHTSYLFTFSLESSAIFDKQHGFAHG